MRSHTHLESLMNHHMETGHTFTENSLGTTTIFTIDPQNIQTYYSTNCKDYGVHRLRKRAFYPLLGDSVLSTDRIGNTSGLDSTYVYKIQRGNFPSFEIRFQEFLKHILRNGTTVNLSPLLDDLISQLLLSYSTRYQYPISTSHFVIPISRPLGLKKRASPFINLSTHILTRQSSFAGNV
ncbi:cytochrome P450 alkane [Botrytis cinerea]